MNYRKLVIPVLINFCVFNAAVGQSSSGDDQASRSSLEEVIVTAQRREQSIMEVPIAVSVASGKALESLN